MEKCDGICERFCFLFLKINMYTNTSTVAEIQRIRSRTDVRGRKVTLIASVVRSIRQREFCSGLVFDFTGIAAEGSDPLQVCFYDHWARAVSFIAVGDEVTVTHFTVQRNPLFEQTSFVTPIDGESEILIAQTSELGDVIELRVVATDLENPEARVRSQRTALKQLHNDVFGCRVICE